MFKRHSTMRFPKVRKAKAKIVNAAGIIKNDKRARMIG